MQPCQELLCITLVLFLQRANMTRCPLDLCMRPHSPFCLCRSLNTAESALKSATDLRKDAMQLCLEDFMSGVRDQSALPAQLFTPGQSYGAEMQLERRSPQAAAGKGPSLCYPASV